MQEYKRIVLGISGASGMPYAVTLAEALAETTGIDLHMTVSDAAKSVLEHEGGTSLETLTSHADRIHHIDDFAAPPSSGSWRHDGMVVCPCSMSSLAAIASGQGMNLIHRAADVTLKEKRKLVLVPRETPLSSIHIRNMMHADEAGATIVPASPGFYFGPESIQDMVNHFCGRILDLLGIENSYSHRWGE